MQVSRRADRGIGNEYTPTVRKYRIMADKSSLSMKLEDYLEAIYWLVEENQVARARDIAAALSVHKSTVTSALRSLSRKGLINYSAYEAATLTPKVADATTPRSFTIELTYSMEIFMQPDCIAIGVPRLKIIPAYLRFMPRFERLK